MKEYNNIDFGKIISDPEYQKAIKTKESFIKKSKKNKEKSGKTTESPSENKAVFEVPKSPYPLLILTTDVFYENTIIKQGFYLVDLKYKGNQYFLELRQGKNTPVALIEATGHKTPGKVILKPQVSVENIDEKTIKINYGGDNLILESILWKY